MAFFLKRKLFKYIPTLILVLLLTGCAKRQLSTWHLEPHEKLLTKNKLKVVSKTDISTDDLASYIRQKPNRGIIFGTWKFGLQWKNLWYRKKSGKKRPAVILDSSLVERSEKQMNIFMKNEGYYSAKVKHEIKPVYYFGIKGWETRKAKVIYTVEPGTALIIDSVGHEIEQKDLGKYYRQVLPNSLIKKRQILRIEDLEEERTRIAEHLTNNGYYTFAENYIRFNVDSTRGHDSTVVITKIKGAQSDSSFHQYYINNIYINTSFDPYSGNNLTTDTVLYKGVYFISKGKSNFNPVPLYRSLFIQSGELYSQKKQSLTFRQFANLSAFSYIKINFKGTTANEEIKLLDAYILLQPSKRISVSAELMGTYREGFGANGQISFNKKNAFGNAELLNFSISGLIENLKDVSEDEFGIVSNIGPRLSLTFPRFFLLPKLTNSIRKNAFPKTTLATQYNFQRRRDFTRYLTTFSFTYEWNEGDYKKHELSPADFGFSFITKDSPALSDSTKRTLSEQSIFEDAISIGLKYSFIYNNQSNKKIDNPTYFTGKAWLVGPSALATRALGIETRDSESNAITYAGIRFATFLKLQSDYRRYFNLKNEQQIAVRSFIGAGIPLDKYGVIPFDQLYFSGGANSVRGWRQRTLGPGSSFDPEDKIDRLGEVKLELNAEYRFNFTSILKGAVFMDAGNIWTEEADEDEDDLDPNFDVNRFYKELAVSPGVGLRLDFDFFLFRLDLGVPWKQAYSRDIWKLEFNRTQFNFGIGYPF